jgi:DNA polymerase-3 subunit epsilon
MAFMSNAVHFPNAVRRRVPRPPTPRRTSFTAIDFETATKDPNSACAIGLVRVEGGRIVRRAYHLIRPPSAAFDFTYLHGIDWATVHDAPTFAQLWPRLVGFFENIDFAAAHNAEFDAGVLRASCGWYGLPFPAVPFECTVRLARASWNVRPTTLRHVADFLGLSLDHHNAASDAEACANIVLRAARS